MEPSLEASRSTAAPYGHACANCSRAKCKCIIRPGGACERCHRLSKQCSPAVQSRKRGSRKPPSATRRAQLEEKLDDLVTLLQAQHSAKPVIDAVDNAGLEIEPSLSKLRSSVDATVDAASCANVWPSGGMDTVRDLVYQTPVTTGPSSLSHISPSSTTDMGHYHTLLPNTAQPNVLLHDFSSRYLQFFPFIYIPPSTNAEDFQRERPFLWLNIQAICTQTFNEQNKISLKIREILAKRVLVDGERSIDLLLGLLAHLSWTHFFARSGKPYIGVLSSIARSLLSDLRLNGAAGDAPPGVFTVPKPPPTGVITRSREESRVLLACYITGSMCVNCFTTCMLTGESDIRSVSSLLRYDSMEWTSYIEESTLKLSRVRECAEDELLIAIARLSRIADDASKVMRCGSEEYGSVLMHVKPLRAELDRIKSSLSAIQLCSKTVLSYLYSAEVSIYQLPLFQRPNSFTDRTFDFRRIEYLHACLYASKSCIENYISLDVQQHACINFHVLMQVLHCIHIVYRLSILDEPDWDRPAVRRTADVRAYLEQMTVVLEKVHAHVILELGLNPEVETVWSNGGNRMKLAIPVWSAGLDRLENAVPCQDESLDPMPDFPDSMMPDFMDDAWFAEMFAFN